MARVFAVFKANYVQVRQDRFASQHYGVVLAVKAFEAIRQNITKRKIAEERSLIAYKHLAKRLKYKAIKSFCVQMGRLVLVSRL